MRILDIHTSEFSVTAFIAIPCYVWVNLDDWGYYSAVGWLQLKRVCEQFILIDYKPVSLTCKPRQMPSEYG